MSDELRPCARGDRCSERSTAGPALGPRPFCETDRMLIRRALTWIPEAYVELYLRLPDKSSNRAERTASKPGPGVPLNLRIHELMADIAGVLESWAEQVRHIARLSGPTTQDGRYQREGRLVAEAVDVLTVHLDVLLALPTIPLSRRDPETSWLTVAELDGADAGIEILDLHHQIRSVLGLTRRHESLPAACETCGLRTLRRYDGDAGLEDSAECTNCGDVYKDERYELLLARSHPHLRKAVS